MSKRDISNGQTRQSSLEIDFSRALQDHHIDGTFDEHTIEVLAYDRSDARRDFDRSRRGNPRRHSGPIGDGNISDFREA